MPASISSADFAAHAERFKALSDETRLAMLLLLSEEPELCVCDFIAVLGITQSKASRHLRYLHAAGLLDDRRDGTWVHYRLTRKPDREADLVLSAVTKLVEEPAASRLRRELRRRLRCKARTPERTISETRERTCANE